MFAIFNKNGSKTGQIALKPFDQFRNQLNFHTNPKHIHFPTYLVIYSPYCPIKNLDFITLIF